MLQFIQQWFDRGRGKQRIADLAEAIAVRSRHAVWQRVAHRIDSLPPAEARGYVCARASATVRQQVDREIDREAGFVQARRDQLVRLAINAVVRLIVAQPRTPHAVAVPVRRAA